MRFKLAPKYHMFSSDLEEYYHRRSTVRKCYLHSYKNDHLPNIKSFQRMARFGVRNMPVIYNLSGLRRFLSSTMQKPEVIFVLGGPGAGKGTTCKDIVKKTNCVHLSAGDLLREERTNPGSEFGELIDEHIKNGTIVPVKITCDLLDRAMRTSPNPHKQFLIDGFPRNQDNLEGWTKEMSDKVIVKGAIYLECSKEMCTQRCINRGLQGSGRSDDNAESLIKRHETFVSDTMPIINYFKEHDLLWTFNSMKSPKKVFGEVYAKLQEVGWVKDE